MRILLLLLLCLLTAASPVPPAGKPLKVRIARKGNNFQLLVNGKPYFIKGAVGRDYLEKLKEYGGNSIRTGSTPQILDKAHSLGLTALVNLPVRAERDGMDYEDAEAVRQQHEKVMEIVRKTKDHPVVLMWALGNELDFIQANVKEHYNEKVWDAVNALAKEIHRVDPNHPVMTVVGSIEKEKIEALNTKCPELDLLGVNEYGDLLRIPEWLRKYGWQKPYAVTEWGPTGFWQVPKTPWKAPIEETSSAKADKYQERYAKTIADDKERCLGSFVFLWRQHQERTHTWFGMFDAEGRETQAVEVMHHQWTGKWPRNRVPQLDSVILAGKNAYAGIYLQAGQSYSAQVWVRDPDKDPLQYSWEVLREGTSFPYGGNGEPKPPAVPGLLGEVNADKITLKSPAEEGAYRLFVYAYDGQNHFATANIPFFVRK
jgi:hypothetical protein